jgi:hypothetical protein
LVEEVKYGALIGQKRVKGERESKDLVIPIFNMNDDGRVQKKKIDRDNFLQTMECVINYK